jgi:hypothetical protein
MNLPLNSFLPSTSTKNQESPSSDELWPHLHVPSLPMQVKKRVSSLGRYLSNMGCLISSLGVMTLLRKTVDMIKAGIVDPPKVVRTALADEWGG